MEFGSLQEIMIIAGQRKFFEAGCLKVTDIVNAYIMQDGKLQQLRNIERKKSLPDRQDRNLIPDILSSFRGQFATNYAFSERVGDLNMPDRGNDCAVDASLDAPESRV
jgi:hypothetical protein